MKTQEEEAKNIELYAEENQEIIGIHSPWLIRWYNITLFLVACGGIWAATRMKCPDVIKTPIQISCSEPPIYVSPLVQGIVSSVMIQDGQEVNAGDTLFIVVDMHGMEHVQRSPTSGFVNYVELLGCHQQVVLGEVLLTINSPCPHCYTGKAMLPASMISRIGLDNPCIISLDRYNDVDYGNIHGNISKINKAPLPDFNYQVVVDLPNGLTTDIGRNLNDEWVLSGTLSIIVEDRSLADLAWKPLRNILTNQQ